MAETKTNDNAARILTDKLRSRFDSYDGAGAVSDAQAALKSGVLGVDEIYLDCLEPLMRDIGRDWQEGALPIWREHATSALVRDVIGALAPYVAKAAAKPIGKTVILACPPEEQHDLGLRMIADLYRLRGWGTVFLGADTPVAEIAAAACDTAAQAIVVSAATHFHRAGLRVVVSTLAASLPGVTILATGSAFRDSVDSCPGCELLNPESLRTSAGAP